jgi:signal recognition particle receptor subunit beta
VNSASGSEAARPRGAGRATGSPDRPVTPLKVVVAGAFGVGKTTFVGSASDITPLRTEEVMTAPSEGIDDLSALPQKRTTTVAMDFGRLDLTDDLVIYLFGTPGQYRFWFMWDQLVRGAVGVVVLVDTRRLIDSFPVLDYFDRTGLPVVVGINGFDGEYPYTEDEVREALALDPARPIVTCDARERTSATQTLATLVEHALAARDAGARRTPHPEGAR